MTSSAALWDHGTCRCPVQVSRLTAMPKSNCGNWRDLEDAVQIAVTPPPARGSFCFASAANDSNVREDLILIFMPWMHDGHCMGPSFVIIIVIIVNKAARVGIEGQASHLRKMKRGCADRGAKDGRIRRPLCVISVHNISPLEQNTGFGPFPITCSSALG